MIVLLKDDLMWAMPAASTRSFFFFTSFLPVAKLTLSLYLAKT
jgi:hypothetical protein